MSRLSSLAVTLLVLPGAAVAQPVFVQFQAAAALRTNADGPSTVDLARNAQVQEELKIADEQKAKIEEAFKAMQAANRGAYAALAQVPQNERQKKQKEIREKAAEARMTAEKSIAAVLDDGQQTRLRQIRIQVAGTRSLTQEDVQGELKLADDQKAKIEEVIGSQQARQQKVYQEVRNGNIPRNQVAARIQEVRAEIEKEAVEALTEAQRKMFDEMRGEKFELQGGAAGLRLQPGNVPRIQLRIQNGQAIPVKPKDPNGSEG